MTPPTSDRRASRRGRGPRCARRRHPRADSRGGRVSRAESGAPHAAVPAARACAQLDELAHGPSAVERDAEFRHHVRHRVGEPGLLGRVVCARHSWHGPRLHRPVVLADPAERDAVRDGARRAARGARRPGSHGAAVRHGCAVGVGPVRERVRGGAAAGGGADHRDPAHRMVLPDDVDAGVGVGQLWVLDLDGGAAAHCDRHRDPDGRLPVADHRHRPHAAGDPQRGVHLP
ncbi:Hypothetical protein, putative, partial [Bodo saltans]